jgi:hypothetical protein
MKATIGSTCLKRLAKIIRYIGKVCGNEVYIEATKENLILKAINSSETAYCIVKLNDLFFVNYELSGVQSSTESENDTFDESNNCKLSTRLLLNAFKNYKSVSWS